MKRTAPMIRQAIENDIIAGDLAPGDRLEEAALAERFGVSRTPVREAVQSLISENLAERYGGRAARVKKFGSLKLLEMFSVMALLDAETAALAARRGTDELLDRMKEIQEACREAAEQKDRDAYYKHNYAFHEAIRVAGGNAFLTQEATKLHRLLSPYLRTQFDGRGRVADSIVEHDLIVAAISDGDGAKARELMTSHVEIKGDRLLALMAFVGDGGE